MTTRLACGLFLSLAVTLSGCSLISNPGVPGSGVSKTELRDVETFEEIELKGAGSVEVTFGDEQSLELTTDDNLLELIETKVEGGKLVIKPTEAIDPSISLEVKINLSKLTSVRIRGAGTLDIDGIQGEKLDLSVDGAGTIKGTGSVKDLKVDISGAGSAKLAELKAENVEIELSGAGSANVFASKSFDGNVSGVGKIDCQGNPEDVKKNVSGIGRIEIGDK